MSYNREGKMYKLRIREEIFSLGITLQSSLGKNLPKLSQNTSTEKLHHCYLIRSLILFSADEKLTLNVSYELGSVMDFGGVRGKNMIHFMRLDLLFHMNQLPLTISHTNTT